MAIALTPTVFDSLANAGKVAGGIIVVSGASIIVCALAPVVSLVALPIFALKALPNWIEHKSLYNSTLENGKRAKYGRIEGQDYTRWNGKARVKVVASEKDRLHELLNSYSHGRMDKEKATTTFNTSEDFDWLKREYRRREAEDLLNDDLKMIRAFAKALIPVAGVLWVLNSETGLGGASSMGCTVCQMGGELDDNSHWGWKEAITHHSSIA